MITIKDLKFSCIGFRGFDDEWYSNSDYETRLKLDNHHYYVNIWKRKPNNWGLCIYLCLTYTDSRDILVIEESAKTMKALKQVAADTINQYHNTDKCVSDIETWKQIHGKKVFDEEYNYLGISYTNPQRELTNRGFDYYNDNKPNIGYGTYYMLEENSVMVCKIGIGWSSIHHDKSEELRQKLLAKIEI